MAKNPAENIFFEKTIRFHIWRCYMTASAELHSPVWWGCIRKIWQTSVIGAIHINYSWKALKQIYLLCYYKILFCASADRPSQPLKMSGNSGNCGQIWKNQIQIRTQIHQTWLMNPLQDSTSAPRPSPSPSSSPKCTWPPSPPTSPHILHSCRRLLGKSVSVNVGFFAN